MGLDHREGRGRQLQNDGEVDEERVGGEPSEGFKHETDVNHPEKIFLRKQLNY